MSVDRCCWMMLEEKIRLEQFRPEVHVIMYFPRSSESPKQVKDNDEKKFNLGEKQAC